LSRIARPSRFALPTTGSAICNSLLTRFIPQMILASIIEKAIINLRSGHLQTEEDVKLAVILPILRALGWDETDRSIRAEYPTPPGRVDYALLYESRPQVFVEAKRRGAMDVRAEAQLFSYANNRGVPLLLLTDGYRWDLYLSMADGLPEERRFLSLELAGDNDLPVYSETLETYLGKTHVASGKARRAAEERLHLDRQQTRARKAIPEAWNALLDEPDEFLCDILSDKVRTQIGTSPDSSDIQGFLAQVARSALSSEIEKLNQRTARDPSPRYFQENSSSNGKLQDVIYDLMRVVLERHPGILDSETIHYMECNRHPFGTKLSYPLIRKKSEGRFINKKSCYKKDIYGDKWYVCTEWNKSHHAHNARMLAEWVNSLIDKTGDAGARSALADIFDRLSDYTENNTPL